MATNWVTISGSELTKVLSRFVQNQSNENTGAEVLVDAPLDLNSANRRDEQVALCVSEFRAAIEVGHRVPLSETESTVPPEVKRHVLNMAAYQLVNSIPTLQMAIMTEKGVYSPLSQLFKDAQKELDRIRQGGAVSRPEDPSEDQEAGNSGDIEGTYDMVIDP